MLVCKGAKKAVTPVTPVTPQPTRSTCSRQRKRTCYESKSFSQVGAASGTRTRTAAIAKGF